jgi:hypothetical protein
MSSSGRIVAEYPQTTGRHQLEHWLNKSSLLVHKNANINF